MNQLFVVMGVSGCGKSSIGKGLAQVLNLPFYDADDFHPKANVEKMKSGIPLNDQDRLPWLKRLNELLHKQELNGMVLACSALKESYRELLQQELDQKIQWIFLNGSKELIFDRMNQRSGHFMPIDLLNSQFEVLEIPAYALEIDIRPSIDQIIPSILKSLKNNL